MFRTFAAIAVSLAAAFGIAAIAWAASRGHVVLFPFFLLFGVPFIPLLARRKSG